MEKRKPHYNLAEIKAAFSDPDHLGLMTGSARNGIRALGFSDEDVVAVVQSLSITKFYKSMTSLRDHKIWQDVYLYRYGRIEIYLKFTRDMDNEDYLLLSFKQSERQL